MKKILLSFLAVLMFVCGLPLSQIKVDAASMTTIKVRGTLDYDDAKECANLINKERKKRISCGSIR